MALVLTLVVLASCRDVPDHGAGPRTDTPIDADLVNDSASVRLSYVCGNRFIVRNAHSVLISVTWRVIGTDEEGSETVTAAPPADPGFSEAQIETKQRGPLELSLDGQRVATRSNDGIPCTPSTEGGSFANATLAEAGSWSAPFTWGISSLNASVAVHLHLLPNGKVLSWGEKGLPRVWDPATKTFSEHRSPLPLFCTGHAFASDGRLVVFGGHMSKEHGYPNVTTFSGTSWISGSPMQRGRWYPTATTMPQGEIVAVSGKDQGGVIVPVPEVWSNGTLRRLTTASLTLPYYPVMFLEPLQGRLFYAGEQQTSRFLSISGTGQWTTAGQRKFGLRDNGSAVMYEIGKILYAGGGRTTATAETIDLNSATPTWQWTGSMAQPRRHHTLTALPTGDVLATGGTGGTAFNDLTKIVRTAEIWSPSTGTWKTLAAGQVPRAYHSTALLLPDGRVLVAGSGESTGNPDQRSAEIFSPPYLFKGTRPRITSAPSVVPYFSTFRVVTPDAASITKVSLVRLGSVTHGLDMNQRFQKLPFAKDATGLSLTLVSGPKRTPPGHYMLFILNGAGVPSVAKIIQIK
jgi:hypothetical protein